MPSFVVITSKVHTTLSEGSNFDLYLATGDGELKKIKIANKWEVLLNYTSFYKKLIYRNMKDERSMHR